MKRTLTLGLFLVVLPCFATLQARGLTTEEKLSDLHQLTSLIKSGYGPLDFKLQQRNINIDQLSERYEAAIRATESNGSFYYLINQFVAEFKDSHFGASVPSNLIGYLGFITDLVEGEVVIEKVDRSILSEEAFPFERGDTVVSMDGIDAVEVAAELGSHIGSGNPATNLRSGAALLARRVGTRVPVVSGDVVVKVRPRLQPWVEKEVTLTWSVSGEPLDEQDKRTNSAFDLRDFQVSVADLYADLYGAEQDFRCSGTTRVKIPADATMIMKEPFVAYYHPTAKGNVGYLRIPHYYPHNAVTGEAEYELRLAQYEYAVSILEENTVGLIIDQDHNCGGSVYFLENMLGLFMEADYDPMQFEFLGTKAEYLTFKGWLDSMDPLTLDYQRFSSVVQLIKDAWDEGQFLTSKTSFSGAGAMSPRSVRYSKPIVMLIDEMSGSGGDAFPAMMGGYGRATLLGQTTMGAGGHVVEQPSLFYSGIKLRMTKSLFFRPDGVAVENNGAVPDITYTITKSDFADGYTDYQAFYLEQLLQRIDN